MLERPDGDRNIIKHAEAGAFRVERMMCPSGETARNSPFMRRKLQRVPGRLQSASHGREGPFDETPRPGKSDLPHYPGGQCSLNKCPYIGWLMGEFDGLHRGQRGGPQIEHA